jgi:hypothetical protein
MKLHEQATEQNNLKQSKRIVYENVHFPMGFTKFLESLVLNHLVPDSYLSESSSFGFTWCDTRKDGGIMIETSQHPLIHNDRVTRFAVEGIQESLDLVENLMTQNGVTYTI